MDRRPMTLEEIQEHIAALRRAKVIYDTGRTRNGRIVWAAVEMSDEERQRRLALSEIYEPEEPEWLEH